MTETGSLIAYPALVDARLALADGRKEQAARLVMTHLRRHPGEPRGLALLGSVAMATGAFNQAERFLAEARARGANDLETQREHATCLNRLDRLDEALALLKQVRHADPADQQTLATIGWIYDKLGKAEEAREIFRGLTESSPGEPGHWLSLGLNLRAAGETSDAVAAFRKAITLQPTLGQPWWELASIKSDVLTDEDIPTLREVIGKTASVQDRAQQHFALGRALHLRQQYAEAFDAFHRANTLLAEDLGYQPQELSEEVNATVATFTANYFDTLPAGGDPSDTPIFIVSLPRSGSTLLEQMLGSHSEIEALGELTYIPSIVRLMMERAIQRGPATFLEAIKKLTPAERTELGALYLNRMNAHRKTGARHITDKMPHNWSNVVLIRHILPNARFIDVRRLPVASGFANFTHSFTRVHSSSFSLEHIGRTFVDYVRLMSHLDRVCPSLVHHVSYEALVEDAEPVLRRAVEFAGLEWEPGILKFHETERIIRTPSAEQVRRPLNREGIGAWKPYAQWLGPLFDALGPLADEEKVEAGIA